MRKEIPMWVRPAIATPWMRFKCWLLHRSHHGTGSDNYESATYYVRTCQKCGLTQPLGVIYDAGVSRKGTDT